MQLKCLVFDIETSPMKAYVWGLKDQNIGLNQILEDWKLLAWGAKWLGESKVMYRDVRSSSEKEILQDIWNLLDQADVVITQNGQSFDSRRLNARFIQNGMTPPSPYRHIDTYLVAKRAADFTSNKLEYLTSKLCVKYKKLDHGKFPGMTLWDQCLKGNKKAWEEMKIYNIHDVLSTEELYTKLRAWGPQNMPVIYGTNASCKVCGSPAQRRGTMLKGKSLVQRIQCKNAECGRWDTESMPKEKKPC